MPAVASLIFALLNAFLVASSHGQLAMPPVGN
jgi:hypothetical protein